ncbi:hypothetical protein GLOIN_2v1776930 [Rhizophagus irregularis DAOM 181602=DAOM 197198]|nr:hypothetical protein GLOIN_2v1776930 [Rhizophagus irregularis DAOM 181602=DAOM 197198]
MEKNNPFLVTGTLENQITDKPEKLDYKTAADKLTRCLRDIVSTSVSADTIRQALILQEKLSNKRARRKGDKMWVSVEVELKEKKLTNLQICMRNATQESQNYASTLNRGALNRLEDVIDSNKHKSEPIDLKRKISKSSISDHNNNDRKIFTHVLFA